MRKLPIAGLATAAVLFVVDQLTKVTITDVLQLNELTAERTVTSFFNLRFVANHGISLGLLHADSNTMRWGLVAMTGAIALAVAIWMTREPQRGDQMALGAVLGGALGNIVDRVRFGYVVDFADLHFGDWRPFLVFNVADAAITLGVLVLLVRALLMRDKRDIPSENPHA
ncbi:MULTISPECIES: signal peptidase II [Sphingomonas]|uniref:Lipoprotein signal peptidase n=1 Tax=Sphingomonas kyungheensis TaxID=1069987 RepID=A0ABU8H7T7_9SPHN|nr:MULTISPECIES: signal peptidase II [unclassified Sphingomonas]EZP54846.1 Lipoprotein signal peptidase [Sphingomonas sp. RIT328]